MNIQNLTALEINSPPPPKHSDYAWATVALYMFATKSAQTAVRIIKHKFAKIRYLKLKDMQVTGYKHKVDLLAAFAYAIRLQ